MRNRDQFFNNLQNLEWGVNVKEKLLIVILSIFLLVDVLKIRKY